ncbi:MAG: beta-L-arabinofuranosidase domain-containing protein [Lentisphaeria bacterium]
MKKWSTPNLHFVKLNDDVLKNRIQTNSEKTIPTNIEKCQETGRIDSFKLEWKEGKPNCPHVFWDSDFAKVLEGLAYDLILFPSEKKKKLLNQYVDLIISAQQEDGYLNTHFTQVEPDKRWTNIFNHHELYCAGHLMEAAVAHFHATGQRNFLDCMCRYADYIATVFGPASNQKHAYPGHEEIELALCRLADATNNPKYLKLAKYFIDERGKKPNYFVTNENLPEEALENRQMHKPVREQHKAIGHAVRALYLYSGMADTAERTNDTELFAACETLWQSVTERNMYITGGVGSTRIGEAIAKDYYLPNVTAYAETCASIAAAFFALRMLNITGKATYADILEREIYNGILSGVSLDGVKFFYENPLINDQMISNQNHNKFGHLRQPWFQTSCCPTNICRFCPQIGSMIFSCNENSIAVHIPAASEGDFQLKDGKLNFKISGKYPYDGAITIDILEASGNVDLYFRIPDWCNNQYTYQLKDNDYDAPIENGYLVFKRSWEKGDQLNINLDMKVQCMRSNSKLPYNAGKIALKRGPLVYALESIDNNYDISQLKIPTNQEFTLTDAKDLPAGTKAICGKAILENVSTEGKLYSSNADITQQEVSFTAIPEALWQNRGKSSMYVWVRSC